MERRPLHKDFCSFIDSQRKFRHTIVKKLNVNGNILFKENKTELKNFEVREADLSDMTDVCRIVNYYIESTFINFRIRPQEVSEWEEDWKIYHRFYPWYVAVKEDIVTGIAYSSPFKQR